MSKRIVVAGALFASSILVAHAATAPAPPASDQELSALPSAPTKIDAAGDRVVTRGGTIEFRWNDELLGDLGMPRVRASVLAKGADSSVQMPLAKSTSFEVDAKGDAVRKLAGGTGTLQGGVTFKLSNGRASWHDLSLRVRGGDAPRIDFVGADGEVWFYADTLMYEIVDAGNTFSVDTGDLRLSPLLAKRIGHPEAADLAVADVALRAPLTSPVSGNDAKSAGNPNWPGEAAPNSSTYKADVFMLSFTAQYSRCRNSVNTAVTCDGPGGANDGQVVFTPSSQLSNNTNNGTAQATVSGDPLGTSSALYTADIPWYTKFAPHSPTPPPGDTTWDYPYPQNDQHPYLIWNLYRLDTNGSITQVGRSGIKHAFLTTNQGGQCDASNGSHVLGLRCTDIYAVSNNDSNSALGPRSEVIAATGQWGRCHSIYDADCNNAQDATPNGNFDNRLLVRESSIEAASNPGATYMFESWYVIRDDINIYNTMASRPVTFSYSSLWSLTNGSPYRLGPVVDRWVERTTPTPLATKNVELAAAEGHAKLAVKVTDLLNGTYRYDYALMNLDFSRASTVGVENDHSLQVLANHGFKRFTINRTPQANIVQTGFADGDANAANDWNATVGPSTIEWLAPDDASSLDWGNLLSFSVIADAQSSDSTASVEVTLSGSPASYTIDTLQVGTDNLLTDGFE